MKKVAVAEAYNFGYRRAVPEDGALLLVERTVPDNDWPSTERFMDIVMLALTGGKERSVEEYGNLLARASFRLNQVFAVRGFFR